MTITNNCGAEWESFECNMYYCQDRYAYHITPQRPKRYRQEQVPWDNFMRWDRADLKQIIKEAVREVLAERQGR